jgi:cytochrome c-type biogenesis protein
MAQFLEAFSLGNAAILGNVCMLPLYPGLFVLMANQRQNPRAARSVKWMGVLVLAGIVTVMVALGFLFHQIQRSVADVLGWLLPVMYGLVLVLGIAMLAGRNPFARLSGTQVPILRSPPATAYVYGMLLAPLTLPCTGPLIVSAFVVGSVSGGGALVDSLLYFLWFALGFGWPLVLLPLLAAPAQQQITRFLTRRHRLITVLSGVLLVAIALFGYWTDVRPEYV